MTPITLAYVPLTDALPLIVAREAGFFTDFGLEVELVPMNSWAQLRDALLLGTVDAAHCLAGIPLASQAGLYGAQPRLATALTLNHFGNAITLSRPLAEELAMQGDFAAAMRRRMQLDRHTWRPLTFASVFPVSRHEFELRHWLRSMDINPDEDVRLIVVPPSQMDAALKSRQIDGFCVGEPWSSLAAINGTGHICSTSQQLALPGTEKVLAARADWIATPAHEHLAAALLQACHWLDAEAHRRQALPWLAAELDLSEDSLHPALLHSGPMSPNPQFWGVNRPDHWQARWLLTQIANKLPLPADIKPAAVCAAAFQVAAFETALATSGLSDAACTIADADAPV